MHHTVYQPVFTLVSHSQTILGEGLVDWHHIVRSGSLDIGEQEVMTFAHVDTTYTHIWSSINHTIDRAPRVNLCYVVRKTS